MILIFHFFNVCISSDFQICKVKIVKKYYNFEKQDRLYFYENLSFL